ncbi:MAG: hypothetical protein J6S67_07590 [Methanobrevibacter sp.]|nr:hypothetical protein [Methanobrevibacter sp.]
MQAANQIVDIIQELIKQDDARSDSLELCQVVQIDDPSHYSVRPVSDLDGSTISKVVNMTRFDLDVNDYCYVYKIGNSFANAFICYTKGGTTSAQCNMIQQMIDDAIAPLKQQITVLQNITINQGDGSNLPEARGEYF